MHLTPSSQTILKTLSYADIFDFPLTVGEIHRFLISDQKVSLLRIKQTLKPLLKRGYLAPSDLEGRVGDRDFFYSLAGRNQLFARRRRRQHQTEEKAKIGESVGKWLIRSPMVTGIYLTGAVSVGNATKNDDIDLMIITKTGWLWTTRLITIFYLQLLGKRRKPEHGTHRGRVVSGKICPNLFLDESSLTVPADKQNLYTAHEVVQAVPLFTKNQLHQRFLWANRWVQKYLPNSPIPARPPEVSGQRPKKFGVAHSPSFHPQPPPFILDSLCYRLQLLYMNQRKTTELVTPSSAYFHPRNTAKIVLDKYHQRLKKLGIKS